MTVAVTSYVAGRWQDPAGDRVALLDGGKVVASGTHRELLAASESYRAVVARGLAADELAGVAGR